MKVVLVDTGPHKLKLEMAAKAQVEISTVERFESLRSQSSNVCGLYPDDNLQKECSKAVIMAPLLFSFHLHRL